MNDNKPKQASTIDTASEPKASEAPEAAPVEQVFTVKLKTSVLAGRSRAARLQCH